MLYTSFLVFFATALKIGYSSTATFSAANSGIDGWVTVNDRWISLELDFSSLDYSQIPGGLSCFDDGLTYHLHTMWGHNDWNDRVGATACGSIYTGKHYDPYLACGPYTGNSYCENYDTDMCVTSSSTFDNNNVYACNTTNYMWDPYVCEVGDWSGKYGNLYVWDNMTNASVSSFWEVQSQDVQGMAVVFHCANTNQRAFCAPFDNSTDTSDNEIWQTTTADERVLFSLIYPLGIFAFLSNGSYVGFVYGSIFQDVCDSVIYRIYDSWYSDEIFCYGHAMCKDVVGNVWDPTVSCLYGSDSEFCAYTDYRLCNDSSYSYMCDYANDRYSCAPGDLSGKYGAIDSSDVNTFAMTGEDLLMPPFNDMEGKSIVLECSSYKQILAAGVIMNINGTANLTNFTFSWNFTTSFNFSDWNFSYWWMNETIVPPIFTNTNATWVMTTEDTDTDMSTTTTTTSTTTTSTTTTTTTTTTASPGGSNSATTKSLNLFIYGLIGLVWWRL